MADWAKKVEERTAALEGKELPKKSWKQKAAEWQAKESAELAGQHAETTAAMRVLAEETEARRKEHLAKMKAHQAEHGVGPVRTYSSGGGGTKSS